MEAFATYLIKSVIWLSGFALVYILFLRNERFFSLNRYFLISGILVSFFFPLITVHYSVDLPSVANIQTGNAVVTGYKEVSTGGFPDVRTLLMILYISGVLFFTYMIIKQSRSVIKIIKKAEIIHSHPVKLIRSAGYAPIYSFFSYVFVNPSITDIETKEILNHEMVHIRQMHWVDLVLAELLCILQWFNPMIWIYIRFIRQNHEYLADEVALQRTSDPAIYRAALLNQIVGAPVVSLANSFNYSLNKKRFNMMKNITSSPFRKMKIFLILPFFAIVLYAFAKPEYRTIPSDGKSGDISTAPSGLQQKEVKGKVVQEDGNVLPGAVIVVKGTTLGTTTDANGDFKLVNVPEDASLVISFVGFTSKVMKPSFTADLKIEMTRSIVNLGQISTNVPPPPPPPPPPDSVSKDDLQRIKVKSNGPQPIFYIDGKLSTSGLELLDPNSIKSISVLKDQSAIAVFGEKGKNGVIVVTTKQGNSTGFDEFKSKEEANTTTSRKKSEPITVNGYANPSKTDKEVFVVIEEMPVFPGGQDVMFAWIYSNLKYPEEALKNKITGQVQVNFRVAASGNVTNVRVSKPVNKFLDAEAIRVISSMPEWKPGKQGGKSVNVDMTVNVYFALK